MISYTKSWLESQRGVPAYIPVDEDPEEDPEGEGEEEPANANDVPPFSALEVVDLELKAGGWRYKLSLPGQVRRDAKAAEKAHQDALDANEAAESEEDEVEVPDLPEVASSDVITGAICFAGMAGLRPGVTGRVTFDLPSWARCDAQPSQKPNKMYVKDAETKEDAVLTSSASAAIPDSPTFLVSGTKGDNLIMVDAAEGGGGGETFAFYAAYPKEKKMGGDDVHVDCDIKIVGESGIEDYEEDVSVLHYQPNYVLEDIGYTCFKTEHGYVLDNQSAFLEFHQPGGGEA